MIEHQLIRASAGAGKTYELTSRYIALLRAGASPASILATTFTRKAAGEILERLLRRLAEAAQDEAKAAELDTTVAQCRDMLGQVCRELNRVSIGTIDAFFGKMAQCFHHELQLPASARMVGNDDPFAAQLRRQAIDAMLADEDLAVVLDLIQRLYHDAAQRSVTEFLDTQVLAMYDLYREAPKRELWTKLQVPDGLSAVGFAAAIESLRALLGDATAEYGKRVANDLANLMELVNREDWKTVLSKGIAGQIAAGNNTYYKKEIPEDIIKRVRPFVQHARSQLLDEVAKRTAGLFDLLHKFDKHYTELRQRNRLLLFADLPHRLAHGMDFDEALRMEVYFRLDGRVAHLLLDEFQDTSTQQWDILKPFAQEITAHPDPAESGRSMFCVGDTKQAIYGWRGGCAEIFDQLEADLFLPDSALVSRSKSYRSSQIVLDTVNQMFGDIASLACLDTFADITEAWQARFQTHEANFDERPGYVEMLTSVPTPTAGEDDDDDDEPAIGHSDFVAEHIARIARHAPGKSIGVLVRTNRTAGALIDLLQRRGDVHASGEGGSAIDDDPAAQAALAALTLADHPGHTAAAYHVANSPLGSIIGLTAVAPGAIRDAAGRIRAELIERGYAETIGDWARRLAPHCAARSVIRMTQLVELADQYEPDATLRPGDFVRYARATPVEEPTPAPVRVMTVHRSKGLEFDIVVLPELHKRIGHVTAGGVTVDRPQPTDPVHAVYGATTKQVRAMSEQLQRAYDQEMARRMNDDLCALYVAMTRAKSALYMIVPPLQTNKDGSPRKATFSHASILRDALGRENETPETTQTLYQRGDPGWCVSGPPDTEPAAAQPAQRLNVTLAPSADQPARTWRTVSPSQITSARRVRVDDLLDLSTFDGRRYGSVMHAWFELVEYLPDDAPGDAQLIDAARRADRGLGDATVRDWIAIFRRTLAQPPIVEALSKPTGKAQLWRERPFTVRIDGQLIQGVFDRVVVTPQSVELLDFKTDRVEPGAEDALVEQYRPQIDAYRAALSIMLNRPASAIAASLLLLATGTRRTV